MAQPKYREEVRSRQYDLIFALVALLVASIFLTYEAFMSAQLPVFKLSILLAATTAIAVYLYHHLLARHDIRVTRKKLKIDQDSVRDHKTRIPLKDIEEVAEVRHPTYAQRYGQGGWLSGEKFLSLVGRNGLEIKTKDGNSYFIGSRNARKLKEALQVGSVA